MLKTEKTKSRKRVVVAMSGGIDSSVAAGLLKREGFDLVGVFMKFWIPSITPEEMALRNENRCCSLESEKRARKVARILGIPFYVFDFGSAFKKKVVDYFLQAQKQGVTPNPCVVCNKEIKLGLLLEKALAMDADFVATGHYAQKRVHSGICKLLPGKDKEKDQSYFLWKLDQEQLKHILFPVGGLTKTRVRALAKKFRLPVLNIPESQEICFIPSTIEDFLRKYLKDNSGNVIDNKGTIVGSHRGLYFYTIGQRKGIGLSGGPYYVLAKDIKRNVLIVTKNKKDLYKSEAVLRDINWVSGIKPKLPIRIKAKIRYRHVPALATVFQSSTSGSHSLKFANPQMAVTPGQSVVFLKNGEVLGGGVIC